MIMIGMQMGADKIDWKDVDDLFLIAAFNKTPKEVSAENLLHRPYRVYLLQITEELNSRRLARQAYQEMDVLDVLHRLQQLRKAGKLRNRGEAVQ